MTAYSHHTSTNASSVFAFGSLSLVASQWAIRAIVGAVGIIALDVEVVSLVFIALMATIVVLLPGRSPDTQLMTAELNETMPGHVTKDENDKVLERLTETFNLTDREAEVIRHLCYGRTKQYIAETMCLSENTIRTYSRRAYQKLGVHSRGELQDLV